MKRAHTLTRTCLFISVLSVVILLAACTPVPTVTPLPVPIATALATVPATATNTPLPNATPTLTNTPVPTSAATATATSTPPLMVTASGEFIEVPKGVALPPDLEGQNSTYDWTMNLDDRNSPDFPKDISVDGSTRVYVQNDPTGEGIGRIFTSEIFGPIDPQTGGYLKDGMHRAYPSIPGPQQLDGKCWARPVVMEVDVYIDQVSVDRTVDTLTHKVLSIGGSTLLRGYGSDVETKLLPRDGGYGIVPISFPENSRQASTGKELSPEQIIPLRRWARIRTLVATDGIWIMIGFLNT